MTTTQLRGLMAADLFQAAAREQMRESVTSPVTCATCRYWGHQNAANVELNGMRDCQDPEMREMERETPGLGMARWTHAAQWCSSYESKETRE